MIIYVVFRTMFILCYLYT